MNSARCASVVLVLLAVLIAAALAVPGGSLADAPRGFTPTYTPTITSTPTATVPPASTSTPTRPGPGEPTPSPTPGPLLPETGEAEAVESGLLLALGVMLVLGLPLVILARSTNEVGLRRSR